MYCVVITTCANNEDAQKIASALLSQRLAACIQLSPISSHYRWDGKIEVSAEVQLTIKTKSSYFDAVAGAIKENHSYKIPEIIQLPILGGSREYLAWIDVQLEQ